MTTESAFIDLMRSIATSPAARGLVDDAAVIEIGGEALVVTHDMMIEGIHWLPAAGPADVAWKLVATNLSDLAAKGAEPLGLMLGFTLGEDEWDRDFAVALGEASAHYAAPLLGGDTVGGAHKRVLGMTALGRATHRPVPSRSGARAGDALYVTGTLGDAMAGYHLWVQGEGKRGVLCDAFNRPVALLAEGAALAPLVNAMMDVSDGLLLDASRMANASGLQVEIDLSALPLSAAYVAERGDDRDARISAASWGDDYQLLFAAPVGAALPVSAWQVGTFRAGSGILLRDGDQQVSLPDRLGFQHGRTQL